MNNNKPTDFWAHGWHRINFDLYAQIYVTKRMPSTDALGMNFNVELLAEYLKHKYHEQKQALIKSPEPEILELNNVKLISQQ